MLGQLARQDAAELRQATSDAESEPRVAAPAGAAGSSGTSAQPGAQTEACPEVEASPYDTIPERLGAELPATIEERIAERMRIREARRQNNLERIVLGAAEHIRRTSGVSETDVDEAWVARFFAEAQEIGARELQELWSQILACEVAAPGTISLRALDTFKSLTTAEALRFEQLVRCSCENNGGLFFVGVRSTMQWRDGLLDCGLVAAEMSLSLHGPDARFVFAHGGIVLSVKPRETGMGVPWQLAMLKLSHAGETIARLRGQPLEPDRAMLRELLLEYGEYFLFEVGHADHVQSLQAFLGVADELADGAHHSGELSQDALASIDPFTLRA